MHINPLQFKMAVASTVILLLLDFYFLFLFNKVVDQYSIQYSFFFPFSLQNTSGQMAADLAYANEFHNCFHLISKSQLRGLPVTEVQNGEGTSCDLDLRSRKRLLTPVDSKNSKRVRRAGGKIDGENRKYYRVKLSSKLTTKYLCVVTVF